VAVWPLWTRNPIPQLFKEKKEKGIEIRAREKSGQGRPKGARDWRSWMIIPIRRRKLLEKTLSGALGMLTDVIGYAHELEAKNAKLGDENVALRKLAWDMWRVLDDCEESPYCVERQGKNPAVTWLDPDWSWKDDLERRMKELGMDVSS
jgi:hypothetical protein